MVPSLNRRPSSHKFGSAHLTDFLASVLYGLQVLLKTSQFLLWDHLPNARVYVITVTYNAGSRTLSRSLIAPGTLAAKSGCSVGC